MSDKTKTTEIKKNIHDFYKNIEDDPQHRYKSWEHCYAYFYGNKYRLLEPEILDKVSLHLGMYLASWGMFRGSSGLLWKDYTIYKELIARIAPALIRDDTEELAVEIGKYLKSVLYTKSGRDNGATDTETESNKISSSHINPTITLVSKIMLGINASSIALDEYVCDGIKKECKEDFHSKDYTKILNALVKINGFYENHKSEFDELQNKIKLKLENGISIPYPKYKLLDMYFFQIGERKSN